MVEWEWEEVGTLDGPKFQDPESADKIFRIEKELDELKSVMMKNMDDLLQRRAEGVCGQQARS